MECVFQLSIKCVFDLHNSTHVQRYFCTKFFSFQLPLCVSFDANFGLVRLKHGGASEIGPSFPTNYFLSQDSVDSFLAGYGKQSKAENVSIL